MSFDHPSQHELLVWARKAGIRVLQPEYYPRASNAVIEPRTSLEEIHPFPQSPCIDYGRFMERIPKFVLRPVSVEELRTCMVWLRDRRVPFKVRGGGHSSGGQVLIEDGAVLDITGIAGDVNFDHEAELVSIPGGTLWQKVVTTLQPFGRVPTVWIDNLRTTVAGTLSVGGFGHTTPRYGLQIDNVASLKILTLDGTLHDVRHGDPLFDYSLAGRGQLGVIVEARFRTLRRQFRWIGLHIRWEGFADYVDDMKVMVENSFHDIFRCKAYFGAETVEGFIGDLVGGGRVQEGPWPKLGTPLQIYDVNLSEEQPSVYSIELSYCVPALEFVLPLDEGLPVWADIQQAIINRDMVRYFRDSSTTITVLGGRSVLPLCPLPLSRFGLMVPLRPRVPIGDIPKVLPVLHDIASRVLDCGGMIYMMSVEFPGLEVLNRQFPVQAARLAELKERYDPGNLLNPGLFVRRG